MRRSKKFRDVVRHFNDRGTAWLLESPENLRGLLMVAARRFSRHLDFSIYYLCLLIHHRRGKQEGRRLLKKIEDELRAARGGKAVKKMEQTLAEHFIEEGRTEGEIKAKQDTLLRQLEGKFGAVPADVSRRVRALKDTETLDRLLLQVLHAATLDDMGLS